MAPINVVLSNSFREFSRFHEENELKFCERSTKRGKVTVNATREQSELSKGVAKQKLFTGRVSYFTRELSKNNNSVLQTGDNVETQKK